MHTGLKMAVEQLDSLALKELQVKKVLGNVTHVLAPGESLKLTDTQGIEIFKILAGATEGAKAKMFINGKEVLK